MTKSAVCISILIVGIITLISCDTPCETAFSKLKKCAEKLPNDHRSASSKELARMKEGWIKACKKKWEKIAKDCNKLDDCEKWYKCVDKANKKR